MKCAKCGLDLPDNTKSCPKCGNVNEFITGPAPRKVKPIVWVIAGLAAVGIIALILCVAFGGRGDLTTAPPGAPNGGGLTTLPPGGPTGGGLTTVPPGSPGQGSTTPDAQAKPKPPKAVVDYLEFVKGVEKHRQMLLKDTTEALTLSAAGGQAQSLMSMIDMAMDPNGEAAMDPLADTKRELNRQYKNWLSTLKYFDEKPAPAECREFSGAYRQVLYGEAKTIGDIAVGLNQVDFTDTKDMSKLFAAFQKMKGDKSIQGSIDKSANDADAKLTRLTSNYDMEKPFDVPREQQTSGSIMGF